MLREPQQAGTVRGAIGERPDMLAYPGIDNWTVAAQEFVALLAGP